MNYNNSKNYLKNNKTIKNKKNYRNSNRLSKNSNWKKKLLKKFRPRPRLNRNKNKKVNKLFK